MEKGSQARIGNQVKGVEEEPRLIYQMTKRRRKVVIRRVNHIGIVVRNVYEALAHYDKLFEFVSVVHVETLPDQGVKVAVVPLDNVEIELIEPIDPQTGVAKFLEKRGEGLHHISFEVDDINETLKSLGQKGTQLIDREAREGIRGKRAFIHPSSTKGVLIELAHIE